MVGESCLNVLLSHRPPASVVQLMLQEYRAVNRAGEDPEHTVDLLGRTPLHVAVAYLCSPDVVEVLLSSNSGRQAVKALDMQGRLPLHLAALSSNEFFDNTSAKRRLSTREISYLSNEDVQTISYGNAELLMNEWPEALLVRDSLGITPLEYTTDRAEENNNQMVLSMKSKYAEIRREQDDNLTSINGRSSWSVGIPLCISPPDGDGETVSSLSMTAVLHEQFLPAWPSQ